MSSKSRKRKPDTERSEVNSVLEALKSGSSTSTTKRQRNSKDYTIQALRSVNKAPSTKKNNINNNGLIAVDDDVQNEIAESPSRPPLNEILTNTLENRYIDPECDEESQSANSLLEITKRILEQNTSIMEKQDALEIKLTQLTNNVKTLQVVTQGIKIAVDNWLYPNDRIYEQIIRKELEDLYPDRMERYQKGSKWEALYGKIEHS
ncbi:22930_t:CDS:2, partial [Racocetra persica]